MSAADQYGPRRGACCEAAEEVLRAEVARCGRAIDGKQLRDAWQRLQGAYPNAHAARGRWGDVLKPAIDAGRVVAARRGKVVYMRPADLDVPLPTCTPRPRQFAPHLRANAARGETVIRHLVQQTGHAAMTSDILAAWPLCHGHDLPRRDRTRMQRLVEPAIADGTVLVASKRGHLLFRTYDTAAVPDPPYLSDEDRVLEALRRACTRAESAVPVEEIEMELGADASLQRRSDVQLAIVLSGMARRGRIRATRIHHAAGRLYYSVPGLRLHIRADARTLLDRRLDVIGAYWQATGGLPFTTRRIRRYARMFDPERFTHEPFWRWTNALHHLAKRGVLVHFPRARRRYSLWAMGEDWIGVPESEQQRRMEDLLRQPAGIPVRPSKQFATQLRHDPNEVSRNHDMRVLFEVARRQRIERATTPRDAAIAHRRPLRVCDVDALVAADHPLRPTLPLAKAMEEAARLRKTMQNTELVYLAGYGTGAWYDLERTPDAVAFAAYLDALAALDLKTLERAIDQVQEARAIGTGPVHVSPHALRAQAGVLRTELEGHMRALERARQDAPLTAPERADLDDLLHLVRELALRLARLDPRHGAGPHLVRDEEITAYPLEQAWAEVQALTPYRLRTARLLPNRLPDIALVARPDLYPRRAGRGRPARNAFDRLGFVIYASERWGGPVLRYLAGLARTSSGPAHLAEPFRAALRSDAPETHLSACATLGLLDDAASRAALVTYLEEWRARAPAAMSASAAECAAWALAPLPFAPVTRALEEAARDSLTRLAADRSDPRLAHAASAALAFWRGDAPAELVLEYYGPPPPGGAPWPPVPGSGLQEGEMKTNVDREGRP